MNSKNYEKLIKKHNRPAPRYTSYPTVPYWVKRPEEAEWIVDLQTQYSENKGVDLYLHVPYCEKLCYYCGCSRIISKNHDVENEFIGSVLKEWNIYKKLLGFSPKINSLHLGGGTPTYLSPNNLSKLFSELTQNSLQDFIGSIEIDPRTVTKEHLTVLRDFGISRLSLGIQDFDSKVQLAINRVQPISLVAKLVESIRQMNFTSLNFDLIYGLPFQTEQTIDSTFSVVGDLAPEMIAFYSYAHLPERLKNQRIIDASSLPTGMQKRMLYETGKKNLKSRGYFDIGMDHFALPGSFLFQAKEKRKLNRNFMGYVDSKSDILIGLGPSSISDSSKSFVQNSKEVTNYYENISNGKLALESGHVHSENDLYIQTILKEIMCHGETQLEKNKIPFWKDVLSDLEEFMIDGLIEISGNEYLKVTEAGQPFIRSIAMAFDFHLRERDVNVKFSQTI